MNVINSREGIETGVKLLRLQKHDFLNYLQVILGYLQIDKRQNALKHTEEAINAVKNNGTVMRITSPIIVLTLLSKAMEVKQLGIPISMDSSSSLSRLEGSDDLVSELMKKALEIVVHAQLKLQIENRRISLVVDESETIILTGNSLHIHADKDDIAELALVASKLDYEVKCQEENLIIIRSEV